MTETMIVQPENFTIEYEIESPRGFLVDRTNQLEFIRAYLDRDRQGLEECYTRALATRPELRYGNQKLHAWDHLGLLGIAAVCELIELAGVRDEVLAALRERAGDLNRQIPDEPLHLELSELDG